MPMQKTSITITTSDLMSVAEASRILGRHIVTIYRWVGEGTIASVKFGGVLFIPTSEVERKKKEMQHEGKRGA